jgi:hypothetical protein
MTPIDDARRDAAVLALVQATTRLEALTRVVTPRARREPAARRMLALLEVLRPLLVAVEYLIPERRP